MPQLWYTSLMTPKLNQELSEALHASETPLSVIDPITNQVYVLVDHDTHQQAMAALQRQRDVASIQRGSLCLARALRYAAGGPGMSVPFVLMIIALAATLGVLGLGLVSMLRGGEFNRRHGNNLMRARIITQGVTILLLILFVVLEKL